MSHKKLFNDYMAILGEVYDKELTLVLVKGYWKMLQNIPTGTLENAFKTSLAKCKFFPRPSEILEFCAESNKTREMETAAAAHTQANLGLEMIKDKRYEIRLDAIASKLIRVRFNVSELRKTMLEKDEKWFLKDFILAYNNYAKIGNFDAIDNPGANVKKLISKIGKIERAKNE